MAVEAKAINLNLFTPQLIQDRDLEIPPNQSNYSLPEMLIPGNAFNTALPANHLFYQPLATKTSGNTDSGLTFNNPAISRKRSRDSTHDQVYASPNLPAVRKNTNGGVSQFPSFVDEEILPQIQQHHMDIDSIIAQHTKKIRLELQEKQKQHTRILMATIGEGVMKKLKEKDEQIQIISKLNFALQERVKTLYFENQLLRDLAQTNEATANSLRTNLEQVLLAANVGEERVSAVEEDVESCCGSSDHGGDNDNGKEVDGGCWRRMCRKCGERESCVLLLPCRHLCLCSVCGSGAQQLRSCPVCHSSMNATLHVNMSSS